MGLFLDESARQNGYLGWQNVIWIKAEQKDSGYFGDKLREEMGILGGIMSFG